MKKNHLIILVALMIVSGVFMSFEADKFTYQAEEEGGQPVYDSNGKLLEVRYIRKNAHKDSENLQILADAMAKMKAMDCTDPMSWYMQGAIHGAPRHSNEFCPNAIYDEAVNDAWHNCTHDFESLGLTADDARMHFYTWHKSYLNHFEDVIREVSGKPDFALPYWEYDNSEYQTLPPLFLDTNKSLYEGYRNYYVNEGNSVQTDSFYNQYGIKDFTNPEDAFDANSFHFFTRHLESVPHNMMHVYLGGNPTTKGRDPIGQHKSGYMLQMYSPMDPIFWVHHANIDRLYEKWLIEKIDKKVINGGRPMKERFVKNKWFYRFYVVGQEGITHYDDLDKVYDDLYGVQTYAYDMFIDNGSYDQNYEDKVNKSIKQGVWEKDPYRTLRILADSHEKNIPAGGAADPNFTLNFETDTRDLKIKKEAFWSLKIDVEFTETPKGVFTVIVKDKDKSARDEDFPNGMTAGVLTFFGSGHNHGGRSELKHEHDESKNLREAIFEFDISDEINFGNFSGEVEFEIIPSDVTDNITIDRIELIQHVLIKD